MEVEFGWVGVVLGGYCGKAPPYTIVCPSVCLFIPNLIWERGIYHPKSSPVQN